jgi:hypothetical protein
MVVGHSGEREERNGDAQRFGRLEVDDQFDLRGLLHWQVSRFVALENPPGVDSGPSIRFLDAATITHQAAGVGELIVLVNRRHRIAQRKFGVEPFLHLLGACQRRLRHLQGCKLSRAETRREFPNAESAQFVRVSEKSSVQHYSHVPERAGKDGGW